jgi:hypothetical protein
MCRLLHPYHDASGILWPELDTRTVCASTMGAYLDRSRHYVQEHARRGRWGRTFLEGAWIERADPKGRGFWHFRPAVIWRRLRLGRFGDPAWTPEQAHLQPLFWCPLADTMARAKTAAPTSDPIVRELAARLSAMNLETLTILRRLLPAAEHLTLAQVR